MARSQSNIPTKAILIGATAQALQYGAALLLLPVLVHCFDPRTLGLWYVFVTIQGLAMLIDFGFQPTFARSFSLAFAGASSIQRTGLDPAIKGSSNEPLAASILSSAKTVYLLAAFVVAVLLITAGNAYIQGLIDRSPDLDTHARLAWLVFGLGLVTNVYFLWCSPLLLGLGKVQENYLFLIATRGIFAVSGAIVVLRGGGLLGLVSCYLAGLLLARFLAGYFLRDDLKKLRQAPKNLFKTSEILKKLWYNAGRQGIVMVGAFLILRYNVLVITQFYGLKEAASYGIALQLFLALNAAAQIAFQAALPSFVSARLKKDLYTLRRLFFQSLLVFFVITVTGDAVILLFGQRILNLIGSQVQLPALSVTMLLAATLLLEGNHSNCGFFITTENKVPFVWPAVLSGIATAVASTGLAYAGFGILVVVASQSIVQLAYNNWKWPLVVLQDLRLVPSKRG